MINIKNPHVWVTASLFFLVCALVFKYSDFKNKALDERASKERFMKRVAEHDIGRSTSYILETKHPIIGNDSSVMYEMILLTDWTESTFIVDDSITKQQVRLYQYKIHKTIFNTVYLWINEKGKPTDSLDEFLNTEYKEILLNENIHLRIKINTYRRKRKNSSTS